MRQPRFGLFWLFILGAAAAFTFAVWSAALGETREFWLGLAGGSALAWAGLAGRRRADRFGLHARQLVERGLLADESDLALPEIPRPPNHDQDLEDRGRP